MSIQLKKGTVNNWADSSYILKNGQAGVITDTFQGFARTTLKVGDGTSAIDALPIISAEEYIEEVDGLDFNDTSGKGINPGTYYVTNAVNPPSSASAFTNWILKVIRLGTSQTSKIMQIAISDNHNENGGGPKIFIRACTPLGFSDYNFKPVPTYGNSFGGITSPSTQWLMFMNSNYNSVVIPTTQATVNSLLSFIDDVESGTWTPGASSGIDSFGNYNEAFYTRIGNLCYIYATIMWRPSMSAVPVVFSGLPFTADTASITSTAGLAAEPFPVNIDVALKPIAGGSSSATFNGSIRAGAYNSSLYLYTKNYDTSVLGNFTAALAAQVTTNFAWIISGCYRIANA